MKTPLAIPVTGMFLLVAASNVVEPVNAAKIDTSPIAVETVPAFAGVRWTGWRPVTRAGQVEDLRPIVLTHAGDGSHRIFVATQRGVIHILPKSGKGPTRIFLDIRKRVVYHPKRNEEGLLGLAFHPSYRSNGEFFVYYSTRTARHTSVVSRFRVSRDDPNRADATFEEEIIRIRQPFWNHNGGTICFGPDGKLYIGLGDGGSAKDPFSHGQNLKTLLGAILRIDVDRKDAGKKYAVPADNPFVGRRGARGEIWAYGLRNVWRMAFDRRTGRLWAGDVGQDLWEEIDIIERGGNYGWNLREARHKFGRNGSPPRKDLVEPIFEYHHSLGKSITGGFVYRGPDVPALAGQYLYADYVSGKLWALHYDFQTKRVTSNRPIASQNKLPVLSFGEDERGEAYVLIATTNGRGVYRLAAKK